MKKNLLLIAASYLASYPSENKIFFTKDEQAFFQENDAINHAKSLRAKESDEPEVTAVTREEAEAAEETAAPEEAKELQPKKKGQKI